MYSTPSDIRLFVVSAMLLLWCLPGLAQYTPVEEASDSIVDGVTMCVPEPISSKSWLSDRDFDLSSRTSLTGDWWGLRTDLENSGVTFTGQSTQFGFGVSGGIDHPPVSLLGQGNVFKYTGRGIYNAIIDLEKCGGLPHGKLLVTGEHWYGQFGNVSLNTGAFAPAVFGAALPPQPNNPGEIFLTNFVLTQPLSEKLIVFAGKKVVVGAADVDEFAGGNGTQQFMNQAFIANPAFLLGLPYSSITAGAAMPQEWGLVTGYVYDPQDRTSDAFTNLNDLFSTGAIVGGEVKVRTKFFDKQGDQHLGAIWKHVKLTDLTFAEPPPGVYPEPTVPGFPVLNDSYTIYYGFDQYLVQYAEQPGSGYGLFGRASISDGNPTPVRYFLSAGIGGYSPFAQKRGDQFGIGWYFVGTSTQFGALPQAIFGHEMERAWRPTTSSKSILGWMSVQTFNTSIPGQVRSRATQSSAECESIWLSDRICDTVVMGICDLILNVINSNRTAVR